MATMTPSTRRFARPAVVLTALVAVLVPLAGAGAADAATGPAAAASTAARTTLTIRTPGCDGCQIRLYQAIEGRAYVWQSPARKTINGKVSFTIPTSRTHGLTMSVRAPWESSARIPTGYVTMAAFRYRGYAPGSSVDFSTARAQRHASACWAGTNQATKTLRVGVRKVRVQGTTGITNGTIAWLTVQTRTWAPMTRVTGGIFGTQEVVSCRRP